MQEIHVKKLYSAVSMIPQRAFYSIFEYLCDNQTWKYFCPAARGKY